MENKWEYAAATEEIRYGDRVLEIGCGRGAFLASLRLRCGADAVGIELNEEAAAQARAQNLPVRCTTVEALAGQEPESFDVVCLFQVLEHVGPLRDFLAACLRLLRPGGRLCLGVPNNDGFVGRDRWNPLNQPPHHVTCWGRRALEGLAAEFELALTRVAYEPLAPYHVDFYCRVVTEPLLRLGALGRKWQPRLRRSLGSALRRLRLRRLIRGHTIYASYLRT